MTPRPRILSCLPALLSGLLVLASGCTESLDSPTIVRTPRILAMVAEPPEAAPGQDVRVAAMISVPEDVPRPLRLRWRACLDVATVLDATGLAEVELPGAPDCDEQTLDVDEPYVVRGERTTALVAELRAIATLGGFDARVIETVLSTAGLAYYVDLDVLDAAGAVVVSGYKRAALTTREAPGTNPPAPTFRFGELAISGGEDPFDFTCATESGEIPVVAPLAEVALEPTIAGGLDEEPWLETFPVFDYTGGITTARENAYYTWLATAGVISEFTTRPPERGIVWTAHDEEGPQTLWLVVRDGHLGARACRLDVMVAR